MTIILFYKCCEHCRDGCPYDNHHETACVNDQDAKVCEEGREQVEVVTP